jgi:SAM-dependent methyltransferase
MHPRISEVTCLNLCPEQNATAKERAAAHRSGRRLRIVEASFDATACPARRYDLAFSQDAFLHATHKGRAYAEPYRITRPGGAFVFCDLLCGDAPGLTVHELAGFADENRIEHWLDPGQVVAACAQVGWADVKFVDLTTDLRISFQLMLKKVSVARTVRWTWLDARHRLTHAHHREKGHFHARARRCRFECQSRPAHELPR